MPARTTPWCGSTRTRTYITSRVNGGTTIPKMAPLFAKRTLTQTEIDQRRTGSRCRAAMWLIVVAFSLLTTIIGARGLWRFSAFRRPIIVGVGLSALLLLFATWLLARGYSHGAIGCCLAAGGIAWEFYKQGEVEMRRANAAPTYRLGVLGPWRRWRSEDHYGRFSTGEHHRDHAQGRYARIHAELEIEAHLPPALRRTDGGGLKVN